MSALKDKLKELGKKFGIKLSIEGDDNTKKFISAETNDGKMIYTDAEQWAAGVACYEDEAGTTPCADGEYTLKTGETVVVSEGKVSDIKAAEAEMTQEEMASVINAFAEKLEAVTAELADVKMKLDDSTTKLASAEKLASDQKVELATLKAKAKASPRETEEQKNKPEPAQPTGTLTAEQKIRMAREKYFESVKN